MRVAVAAPSSARAVYAQRSTNTLQRVFRDHFNRFAGEYDQRYARELGNFRIERIASVATRFLSCGDYPLSGSGVYSRRGSCQGVARIRRQNPDCHFEYFRPEFYSTASGRPIAGAAVLAFQPFGEALRHDPHFHALILEGGFDPEGRFIRVPIHDTARLTQLCRQRTVGLFLKLGLITEQFAETLLRWRHSGFSVDNSVLLDGGDHRARQALAQYATRAPLSLQKLTYDAVGGKVLYHTAYNPYLKQNTTLWSAPDFIAHLTQFIPPRGVRYVHYWVVFLTMQGEVAASASHRTCRPPGVAAVPRGADVPTGRRHGTHDGTARRLSLSMGQTDCEGVRNQSVALSPV